MKRKIGDEVLVKAKIGRIEEFPNSLENYRFEINNVCFHGTENTIVEPGMTAEEAWEISKKLFADFADHELDEIFGKGWSYPKLMELSPQEAKAKIEEWESKQIQVGDVCKMMECSCVVTQVDEIDKQYVVIWDDGNTDKVKFDNPLKLHKTGKHIDIQSVLDQIGGGNHD